MLEKNHEKRSNFIELADLCRENDKNIIANYREMISVLPNNANNKSGLFRMISFSKNVTNILEDTVEVDPDVIQTKISQAVKEFHRFNSTEPSQQYDFFYFLRRAQHIERSKDQAPPKIPECVQMPPQGTGCVEEKVEFGFKNQNIVVKKVVLKEVDEHHYHLLLVNRARLNIKRR